MNLILLGAPGSGKGTQAKLIEKKFGLSHISTGDILRQAVTEDTPLGRQVKEVMEDGKLVADSLMIHLVKERLKRGVMKGFILDGFPRTLEQAESLEQILQQEGRKIDNVVYLAVTEETVLQRITQRRICRVCGRNYHLLYCAPRKEGLCDQCGGGLYQRSDDTEEIVRRRFKTYLEQTQPLLEFYEKKGILIQCDGQEDISSVFQNISRTLGLDDYH